MRRNDNKEAQQGGKSPKGAIVFRDGIIKGVQYNTVNKRRGRYIRSEIGKRDVKPKARPKPKGTD